ncbi:MAG TPA: hypothetical protein VLN57_21245 [Xanthobacteraceae bacterium]|nr:hypothetical protein [Xanthobacteraceae bacterium]
MSKSNATETAILALIFNNTTWANIGDATGIVGSTTAGSLFPSLHTADPGEAGTATTSEIAYTGYARPSVARSSGGWTVSGNQVTPVATISFGQMTGGAGGTATFFGITRAVSGSVELLYSGAITTPSGGISVTNTVTPQLTTATAMTED